MKRNGFTLIELLAVIVILAIIAIIATPIVLNIINNAKTSSNERSGELYIKAVENAIMKKQMNGTFVVEDGEYTVQSDGSICIVSNNTCTEGTTIIIDVEGDVPTEGTLTVSNGVVVSYNLVVSGTSVVKGEGSDNGSTTYEVYENGEAVYFNVTTGVKCTEEEAVSTPGTKTGCMKFYAFNDEGETSNTINLILDHNTTSGVKWISEEDFISAGGTQTDWDNGTKNHKGPLTALTQLESDTENWAGVETPENYTNAHYGYTVDYTNYGGKARLITVQEIAKITGADEEINWDESDTSAEWYYLDSNTKTQTATTPGASAYAWLFDYTNNCTSYGCNISDSSTQGYWTVSAATCHSYAWNVRYVGYINDSNVSYLSPSYGVRPVITVLKSKLN